MGRPTITRRKRKPARRSNALATDSMYQAHISTDVQEIAITQVTDTIKDINHNVSPAPTCIITAISSTTPGNDIVGRDAAEGTIERGIRRLLTSTLSPKVTKGDNREKDHVKVADKGGGRTDTGVGVMAMLFSSSPKRIFQRRSRADSVRNQSPR